MKTFILNNIKEILLVLFGLIIIVLLYKTFKPVEDKSELLKYKLEKLDESINGLKDEQKKLSDTIVSYKIEIKKIDESIKVIRNKKAIVNNFYNDKDQIIQNSNNKQIDSLLKNRYNY